MANDLRYRYRITFTKDEAQRFTSHLDLHRAWGRLLRRAGLPLLYSQGFNPRPRIQLSTALPLGCTSEHELADIWLTEEIPCSEILERLQQWQYFNQQILNMVLLKAYLQLMKKQE